MKRLLLLAPLLCGVLLVSTWIARPTQADGEGDAALQAQAARTYARNCQGCHLVPDKQYESDRAWIGQILRTA